MWYFSKLLKYFSFPAFLIVVIVLSIFPYVCHVFTLCVEYTVLGQLFLNIRNMFFVPRFKCSSCLACTFFQAFETVYLVKTIFPVNTINC
jgi:hypothetical protein